VRSFEYKLHIHFLTCRNSSGSSPLHLAASNGHAEVVSYLLKQREGLSIIASLDNDRKTPLDVCLEAKSNDWKATSELLVEACRDFVSKASISNIIR